MSKYAPLKLPSTYSIHTQVTGHVRTGRAAHERSKVDLRYLTSTTGGHIPAYVVNIVHDGKGWREVTSGRWQALAIAALTDAEVDWLSAL